MLATWINVRRASADWYDLGDRLQFLSLDRLSKHYRSLSSSGAISRLRPMMLALRSSIHKRCESTRLFTMWHHRQSSLRSDVVQYTVCDPYMRILVDEPDVNHTNARRVWGPDAFGNQPIRFTRKPYGIGGHFELHFRLYIS